MWLPTVGRLVLGDPVRVVCSSGPGARANAGRGAGGVMAADSSVLGRWKGVRSTRVTPEATSMEISSLLAVPVAGIASLTSWRLVATS